MQESEFGGQITFESGQEIANTIAFLHDKAIQDTFSAEGVPEAIREKMESDE
jgi:hypothetical protein